MAQPASGRERVWRTRYTLVGGFAGLLVAVGLARFAYSPLIPAIIEFGWFSPSEAAYLGAANFAGYLIGAVLAWRATIRILPATTVRYAMLLTAIALLACARPMPFEWFVFWRLISGITGAVIVVLGAPLVAGEMPKERRGLAMGILFAGVATSFIVSGALTPVLLRIGLTAAWLGLAGLAFGLTVLSWWAWPRVRLPAQRPRDSATQPHPRLPRPLFGVFIVYGIMACALVPHMVFLVDYLARELDYGITVGSTYWILLGCAGLVGPAVFGALGDRIGFRWTLRFGMVGVLVSNALIVLWTTPAAIIAASLLVGALIPSISVLVLGRIDEELPEHSPLRTPAWSYSTGSFALAQAAAAYAYSYLFSAVESYVPLFISGTAAAIIGILVDLVTPNISRNGRAPRP